MKISKPSLLAIAVLAARGLVAAIAPAPLEAQEATPPVEPAAAVAPVSPVSPVAAVAPVVPTGGLWALEPQAAAEIEAIRKATAKYENVEVALAEGYIRDPSNLCVMAPVEDLPVQLGGMGVHFFRPDLLGITATGPLVEGDGTHTDFLQPAILLYVPDQTGALRFAGVENLVFEDAWRAAGHTGPPDFMGRQYWHRIDNPATTDIDEAHMFEPHYELHIWTELDNPSGIFTPYNPAVSCDHHDGPKTMAEAAAYMAAHAPPVANQP